MRKYLFAVAIVSAIATPAIADEVGVGVQAGPVGGGVTNLKLNQPHYDAGDTEHHDRQQRHQSPDRGQACASPPASPAAPRKGRRSCAHGLPPTTMVCTWSGSGNRSPNRRAALWILCGAESSAIWR